jgi:hypothetical protein
MPALWHSIRIVSTTSSPLADPTRRSGSQVGTRTGGVGGSLNRRHDAVIHEARPTLERCGLIARRSPAAHLHAQPQRLGAVDAAADQRATWESQTDRLERFVTNAQSRHDA